MPDTYDVIVVGAGNAALYLGDWSRYKVRRVRELAIQKLTERWGEYLQTSYMALQRYDGQLVDSGNHPLRFYKCSAT